MLKNQKGITLIALVVTIIVLLILAGVSIAMLTGDNGILTQTSNAKEKTATAEVEEVVKLSIAAVYVASVAPDSTVPFTIDEIAKEAGTTSGKTVEVKNTYDESAGSKNELTYNSTYTVTLSDDLKTVESVD